MESKFIASLVDFNISMIPPLSDAYNFLSELAPKRKVTSYILFIISFSNVHNEDWQGVGLRRPVGEKICRCGGSDHAPSTVDG